MQIHDFYDAKVYALSMCKWLVIGSGGSFKQQNLRFYSKNEVAQIRRAQVVSS